MDSSIGILSSILSFSLSYLIFLSYLFVRLLLFWKSLSSDLSCLNVTFFLLADNLLYFFWPGGKIIEADFETLALSSIFVCSINYFAIWNLRSTSYSTSSWIAPWSISSIISLSKTIIFSLRPLSIASFLSFIS